MLTNQTKVEKLSKLTELQRRISGKVSLNPQALTREDNYLSKLSKSSGVSFFLARKPDALNC